jgi:Fanconi-associated nuclease 1
VENLLMRHYYGIFFWEEIFYDRIPFVFQTPYQFGPLDFNEPEFYHSRKELLEEKLEKISRLTNMQLKEYFEELYEKYRNVHNPLVNWDNQKLTKQRMAVILKCMGARILTMFLSRLAQDYKQWSFGMPDLILWKE